MVGLIRYYENPASQLHTAARGIFSNNRMQIQLGVAQSDLIGIDRHQGYFVISLILAFFNEIEWISTYITRNGRESYHLRRPIRQQPAEMSTVCAAADPNTSPSIALACPHFLNLKIPKLTRN